MSDLKTIPWQRILIWALVLGVPLSLWLDWGQWSQLPLNMLYRVLITAVGGVVGWVLNLFTGGYVGMTTHVIESTGIFRFSDEAPKKIENSFIFVLALVGDIFSAIIVP